MQSLSSSSGREDSPSFLLWGCGVLALALVPSTYWLLLRVNNKKKVTESQQDSSSLHRKRTFSFTSEGMMIGCFPKAANVPETIINAVMLFDQCLTDEELIEQVIQPMLQFERLSSIPDLSTSSLRSPSEPIEASKLIRRFTLHTTNIKDVYDLMFEHLQDPLTREDRHDLPWWEFLVVENTAVRGDAPSALVLRIHHGLADGISLVQVFENIVTTTNGQPLFSSSLTMTNDKEQHSKSREKSMLHTVWSLVKETLHVLMLGASKYDDDIAFASQHHNKVQHSHNRSYVVFPNVDLEFIKALKNAGKVTVNDILMTAVSQAIFDYCLSQQCPILSSSKHVQCRALLPVAFPRSQEEMANPSDALRNKWCMVSADLGVGCKDIIERLEFVHSKTQEIKSTPRAYMQLLIQNTIPPLLPVAVAQQTVYDVFTRHSLVFSNVPGPSVPCQIAGKTVLGVQMFYANLIPQIGFLSYAGTVFGNMVLDPDAIPNSQSLATLYARALLQLADRLKVPKPSNSSEVMKCAENNFE